METDEQMNLIASLLSEGLTLAKDHQIELGASPPIPIPTSKRKCKRKHLMRLMMPAHPSQTEAEETDELQFHLDL